MAIRCIAIDRSSGHAARDQIVEQGAERLKEGLWVTIFPEGTRVPPGKRGRYGIGGAMLATRTGTQILPIAHNAGEFWGRYAFKKRAGVVKVVIGAPIQTRGTRRALRQQGSRGVDRGPDARDLRRSAMPTRELVSRDAHRLALGADTIEYVLVRRFGRRGVGLKVDENGLTVSAPSTMPLAKIEALVRESERWILRKIAEWSHRKIPPVQWREGERIPFLGGGLTLRLGARWPFTRRPQGRGALGGHAQRHRHRDRAGGGALVQARSRMRTSPSGCRRSRWQRGSRIAHAHDLVGHGAMGQLQLEARGAPRVAPREGAAGSRRLRDLPRARAPAPHGPLECVLGRSRATMSRLPAAVARG